MKNNHEAISAAIALIHKALVLLVAAAGSKYDFAAICCDYFHITKKDLALIVICAAEQKRQNIKRTELAQLLSVDIGTLKRWRKIDEMLSRDSVAAARQGQLPDEDDISDDDYDD